MVGTILFRSLHLIKMEYLYLGEILVKRGLQTLSPNEKMSIVDSVEDLSLLR